MRRILRFRGCTPPKRTTWNLELAIFCGIMFEFECTTGGNGQILAAIWSGMETWAMRRILRFMMAPAAACCRAARILATVFESPASGWLEPPTSTARGASGASGACASICGAAAASFAAPAPVSGDASGHTHASAVPRFGVYGEGLTVAFPEGRSGCISRVSGRGGS